MNSVFIVLLIEYRYNKLYKMHSKLLRLYIYKSYYTKYDIRENLRILLI